MSNMIVTDASHMAKWYLTDEENTTIANNILNEYTAGTIQIYLPYLAIYELGNIFFVAQMRNRISMSLCEKNIENFLNYPFVYKHPSYEHAMKLSLRYGITFYDASYIALAEKLSGPMYTGDMRLYKTVSRTLKFVHPLNAYATQ